MPVRLLRWRPFLIAACASTATVVVLFAWLFVAAVAVGIVGCALAFTARSRSTAELAAGITSAGLGLAVGPVLYLALWVVVSLAP